MTRKIVLGTAGHVDHGKTQLVKWLTGTDTDRLEEEQRRGITIDLGFAFMDLGQEFELAFVDVPGHERFVRNMVAGIGGVDGVVLVVAADEGFMPQTFEHLHICELLGLSRGIVVLTKCDLVDAEWLELAIEDTRTQVAHSFLNQAPIVPVSATSNEGRQPLIEALSGLCGSIESRDPQGPSRLPVDRAFHLHGRGAIVTGTLFSGRIAVGDRLKVYPLDTVCKVREVRAHGSLLESAAAGQRVALNLSGVDYTDLARGMVVCAPDRFENTQMLNARVHLLDGIEFEARPRIRFHLGTSEVMARLHPIACEAPYSGSFLAQIRLERPVVAVRGDRFILRRFSPLETIGGGRVLDGASRRYRRRLTEFEPRLKRIERGDWVEGLRADVEWKSSAGLTWNEMLVRVPRSEQQIGQALARLVDEGHLEWVEREPAWVISPTAVKTIEARLCDFVREFHQSHPLKTGMNLQELRSRLAFVPQKVLDHSIERLARQAEVSVDAQRIRLEAHRVELTPELAKVERELLDYCVQCAIEAPKLDEVIDEVVDEVASRFQAAAQVGELVQLLVESGRLVRVKSHLYVRATFDSTVERLRTYLQRHESITVAEFRDLLGVSRRHALPLLEHFDQTGITARIGDARVLR